MLIDVPLMLGELPWCFCDPTRPWRHGTQVQETKTFWSVLSGNRYRKACVLKPDFVLEGGGGPSGGHLKISAKKNMVFPLHLWPVNHVYFSKGGREPGEEKNLVVYYCWEREGKNKRNKKMSRSTLLMILLQQNKRRWESGKKCHATTMMHSKPVTLST